MAYYFVKGVHLMNPFYVNNDFVVISYNTDIAMCMNLSKSKLRVFETAPLALKPVNIMAGFKHLGISPLNPGSDFMPFYFSDRPTSCRTKPRKHQQS